MDWWHEMGVWDQRPEDLEEPSARFRAQPLISGTRGGHALSLHQLAREGVTVLGRLAGVRGRRLVFAGDAERNVTRGDEVAERERRQIDHYIEQAGIHAPPPKRDPADAPEPALRRTRPAAIRDVGAIVWCTGFGGDFGYLHLPVLDADRRLVQRGGATASPGLFAIGLPWLRTRKSGIVWGMREDAQAVADAILKSARGALRSACQ